MVTWNEFNSYVAACPLILVLKRKYNAHLCFKFLHIVGCYCQQKQANGVNIYFSFVFLKTNNLGINLGIRFVQIKYFCSLPKCQLLSLKGLLLGVTLAITKAKWGSVGPGMVAMSELSGHMREGTEPVKYYSDSFFFIKEKCLQT